MYCLGAVLSLSFSLTHRVLARRAACPNYYWLQLIFLYFSLSVSVSKAPTANSSTSSLSSHMQHLPHISPPEASRHGSTYSPHPQCPVRHPAWTYLCDCMSCRHCLLSFSLFLSSHSSPLLWLLGIFCLLCLRYLPLVHSVYAFLWPP